MKLVDNKVLVKEITEDKTPGGIVLPQQHQRANKGTVTLVGPGVFLLNGERATMVVKNGDKVFYIPNTGYEVEIDKKKYRVIVESDILVIL